MPLLMEQTVILVFSYFVGPFCNNFHIAPCLMQHIFKWHRTLHLIFIVTNLNVSCHGLYILYSLDMNLKV
jgi:hypothetical protein